MQSALLSEREETKMAMAMEKQAMQEARTARIKVSGPHTHPTPDLPVLFNLRVRAAHRATSAAHTWPLRVLCS